MTGIDLRVYALIDPSRTRQPDLAEAAYQAAHGGATLIQYRDKTAETRAMIERARGIAARLEGTGVPLLINDRVDVALAAGADGVHLGQKDMEAGDARRILGEDAVIGLTVKNAGHIDAAPRELIDYVCIGGVFATTSKDNPDAPVGLDGLRDLAAQSARVLPGLPVGAIAGITLANAQSVIAAGVGGVAVISEIFMADNIAGAVGSLRRVIDEALGEAAR